VNNPDVTLLYKIDRKLDQSAKRRMAGNCHHQSEGLKKKEKKEITI
jgi:hypothetical protein